MTTLPTNWTEAPIRELMQPLQDGKLVHQGWSPQCESGPALSESDWGALKTTAIQDGSYQPEHNKRLPETLEPKVRLEVNAGDLLMTCAGPRVRCGVACLVRETPSKRFISGKMYRFRANEALIDSRLLEAFLRTPSTKAQIDAMKTGISESGMNITHEKFSQLIVPIASRAEQKRIADKLDTVLTRVDAVNTRLARVAPLLKRFRQSVLAAATSGRLTEDWRHISPASVKWQSTTVEAVCSKIVDCPHSTPIWATSGVPCVRTTEFSPNHLDIDSAKLVSEQTYIERTKRLEPAEGDVLYSREGTVGVACNIPAGRRICLGQRILLLRPSLAITSKFLMFSLNAPEMLKRVGDLTMGSTAPRLNIPQIKVFPIALPSIEEQTEIVRRVETLFAFADRLEARLAQAQTAATRLTPALLAKAFRGELVPQDPNDEPAAELLRRLAEKPTTPAKRGRAAKAV